MSKARSGGEDGSIVLTVLVIIVASALVVALVGLTENGLRQSRRSGDSASALQVADAGASDAVAKASGFDAAVAATGPTPAGYTCVASTKTCTGTVTVNGSTTEVVATRDPATTQAVWHIVSTATDATSGQKRRVRVDAVATIGPANALFVSSNLTLNSGTEIDSYRGSATAADRCTWKGYVGTNEAASMTLGTSGNSGNCRGSTWGYYFDGCISYADINPASFPASSGCPPPPAQKKSTPAFVPENVYPPAGSPVDQPGACTAANPIPAGTHFWNSVSLQEGCRVEPVDGTVKIVTLGDVNIGGSGNANPYLIHAPAGCTQETDAACYASGWPGKFEISVVSSDTPTRVNLLNAHMVFFGVINAPTARLSSANGVNHLEYFGSLVLGEATAPVQLALHYDESLGGDRVGRYVRRNWVQEPA